MTTSIIERRFASHALALAAGLAATLAVATPASARCIRRSATLVSPANALPPKGVLVVRLQGHDKADLDAKHFIAKARIVAKKGGKRGKRYRLRLVASLPGAKDVVQIVVAAKKRLKPGEYTLRFPKRYSSYPQPVRIVSKAATSLPKWKGQPKAVSLPSHAKGPRKLRGGGGRTPGRSIDTNHCGSWHFALGAADSFALIPLSINYRKGKARIVKL